MKPRKWTVKQLEEAVKSSTSIRQVLGLLGLRAAGGNYRQINKYIEHYNINTSHFLGKGWNIKKLYITHEKAALKEIMVVGSMYQSYKLKRRLIKEGVKQEHCEQCGWSERSLDGRIPLELHHINGIRTDNRLENPQVLCPNCHSLKPNHRGKNIKK